MERNLKTSKKKRGTYVYYNVDGKGMEIFPGENEVTEVHIKLLHEMDDEAVDEKRRYYYMVVDHIEEYYQEKEGKCEEKYFGFKSKYLIDNEMNPEVLYIKNEEKNEKREMLNQLRFAMKTLLPEQRNLFSKKYVENRSNTDIAKEEGVSESAIRGRLKRIEERILKNFK